MISFIVPAHDEAALIGDSLDALHAAAMALSLSYEVIVVDDASTDDTAALAQLRGARVLHVGHRQIAAVRNTGAAVAGGERLVFLDADTRIDRDVLAAAMKALDQGAAGGGCAVRFAGATWSECVFTALLMRVFHWTRIAPGCFIFCTREAFDAAGGFDERWYAGEDVAISRALAVVGQFVILRESVTTSDRKLRTFGWLSHLRLLTQFIRKGRRLLHSREHLGIWYDKRR
jgi:glycosyltransferase involved in cell wall biosynthesis